MKYTYQFTVDHSIVRYTDETETEEKELPCSIVIMGEFEVERSIQGQEELVKEYTWDLLDENKNDITKLVGFFDREEIMDIEEEVEIRVEKYIEEALDEWRSA